MNDVMRIPSGEMAQRRRRLVEDWMVPLAETLRLRHAAAITIRSIAVCVAQYWNDEGSDAVQCQWVISQLDTPDWSAGLVDCYGEEAARTQSQAPAQGQGRGAESNLPPGLAQFDLGPLWGELVEWDHNRSAVPIAAAWCREGADQDAEDEENYLPFVILRHDGRQWSHELMPMVRPWLDGVQSQDLLEWPSADDVWARSLVSMPPNPRAGDVALAEVHALGRVLAEPRWWRSSLDRRVYRAPPPARYSLAVIAESARYFGLSELASALDAVNAGDRDAEPRVVESYPGPGALKAAFERTYESYSADFAPMDSPAPPSPDPDDRRRRPARIRRPGR